MATDNTNVTMRQGFLPGYLIKDYYGTTEDLIAAGVATEKMMHIDPRDGGFGFCFDEFGNECTVMKMPGQPGVFELRKYLSRDDAEQPTNGLPGKSMNDIDLAPILERLAGGAS